MVIRKGRRYANFLAAQAESSTSDDISPDSDHHPNDSVADSTPSVHESSPEALMPESVEQPVASIPAMPVPEADGHAGHFPSSPNHPDAGQDPERPDAAPSSHLKESIKMSETETAPETETVAETEAAPAPVAKTDEEIQARLKEAQNMTKNYMFASLGTGLVPVPTVDIGILIGIQTRLLYKLAKLYDLKFSEDIGKKLLLSLLGGTLPVAGGMGVASMLKAFPGVGSWLGMTSMAIFGAASTYAVGRVFIQHFESGGNFFNFDPAKTRAYFREEFEAGKKVAEEMRAEQSAA
ncbi:MAG: DUF697 domain-containing protein [Magnetococcales bacterium]|nr:DUF697 domain-containing protein [Magnetococcales bacterium]